MDRRTFVLLTSAASVATIRRPILQGSCRAAGRLRFDLDDQRRWSLSYLGDGQPVPLIRAATLGAWIGERFIALGDLEYTSVGTERFLGGEALRIRGNAADVSLDARFFTSMESPVGTITLNVLPDRALPTVKGVRFFQAAIDEVLPASAPAFALVEARDSSDAPRMVPLPLDPAAAELSSYGVLGLTRGQRGLGLVFDASDPGGGTVRLAGPDIEAGSEWTPARALAAGGDASRLHLCFDPDGDGLTALRDLMAPTSAADRARMLGLVAPAGWSTRGLPTATVTEDDVLANADICATRLDRRFCRLISVGDGYQRALGDWETNERFSHGHRWLTDQLHSRGLEAGLWIAPLAAAPASAVARAHPQWLLKPAGGLDAAHPEVREWLTALARRAVREWGYDYLEIDFLGAAALGDAHYGGRTHAEAYRIALDALRDGAGADTPLRAAGAWLEHSVGLVSAMRIVPSADGNARGLERPARLMALRSFYDRGAWLNDPGPLTVGAPLSRSEAECWASIVAVSGTLAEYADDLRTLPADRLEIIARTLPPAPAGGRPLGATADGPPRAWVTEASAHWWTVVLANWGSEPADLAVPLADLGAGGSRFDVYDVWRNVPLPAVTDVLRATVAPRSASTIALRAASSSPQVIGTTRHVVQGAVDVGDETWDAATRTLRGRARNLDSRAYAITIAIPADVKIAGGTARTGGASVACSVSPLESGHAVLAWEAGAASGDVDWTVTFESLTPPPRAPRRKSTRP